MYGEDAMRSMLIALVLAAPLSAVAATPDYTHPVDRTHTTKATEQWVGLTFATVTGQDREILVGDKMFKLRFGQQLSVAAPVGTVVRVYSDQNSRLNGQVLMEVGANDARTVIRVQ
jgi:opacity protein-like surface antigen